VLELPTLDSSAEPLASGDRPVVDVGQANRCRVRRLVEAGNGCAHAPRAGLSRCISGDLTETAGGRSAVTGSGGGGLPGSSVPMHLDQDLLGIRHAADHHHRAVLGA
jgi:hypothetical protein